MAYLILEAECTGCSACEVECPNAAIKPNGQLFRIRPEKCSECVGFFDAPQCIEVCPAPGAVIVNPDFPRYQAA